MIKAVIDSLDLHGPEVRYTFIVQKSHYDKYDLLTKLSSMVRSPNIIVLDGMTEGAAATALLAKHIIDSDVPLIIANSDQVIDWDSIVFKSVLRRNNPIALFTDEQKNPKWSFAKIENGMVTEVAEKNPISEYASVGIYGWSKGSDYVKYAEQMIEKDVRVNNEFYICPVYNEAIQDGLKVIPYFVDSMHGLGTPEDLEEYLRSNND
jgi:dTDP-glucose pyrophosphorylase